MGLELKMQLYFVSFSWNIIETLHHDESYFMNQSQPMLVCGCDCGLKLFDRYVSYFILWV